MNLTGMNVTGGKTADMGATAEHLWALDLAQAAPNPNAGGGQLFFFAILMAFLVFMVMSQISRSRRERREREQLYGGLAKNDRVLTIGGIYGTIVTLREHDVVLKVDESSNTKMTFLKTAIQKVVSDKAPE